MNRILFCSAVALDKRLGTGKAWLELVDTFLELGWDANAIGPDDYCENSTGASAARLQGSLREYLRRHSAEYSVVEYDFSLLPFSRCDFPCGPLFVARCHLLQHHFLKTPLPPAPGFVSRMRHAASSPRRGRELRKVIAQNDVAVWQADLTVVSNDRDADALVEHGADRDRILVFPLGISAARLQEFDSYPRSRPEHPVVGFIGTFDPRKGMREFPELVRRIAGRIPDVTFRLLGTSGFVRDVEGVRSYFPRSAWPRLEIHPEFDPARLPELLADVSVGVFPSRVEGFGYGVLEMLAAGVPVVAYDAPGPHMMLPPEFMVPVADVGKMSDRAIEFLADPIRLESARQWARIRAGDFKLTLIGEEIARTYQERLDRRCRSVASA